MSTTARSPRILILYYSLSGQSRGLVNLLAIGMRDHGATVFVEQIRPQKKIGFPFRSILKTVYMMAATFFRVRIPIEELSESCFARYDLCVLAGPTWSYNPSGPILSLIDGFGQRLFGGRTVVPLISCRGYFRLHERVLRRQLETCGARVEEGIVFRHPVPEPWSTIGVFLKSAGYHPERMTLIGARYRRFGHDIGQLREARRHGERLVAALLGRTVERGPDGRDDTTADLVSAARRSDRPSYR